MIYWHWYGREGDRPTTLHQDGGRANRAPTQEVWALVTGRGASKMPTHSTDEGKQGSVKSIPWEARPCLSGDPARQSTSLPRSRSCNLSFPRFLCRRCRLSVLPDSCRRWVTMPTPDWQLGLPCVSCGFPIFSDETSHCKWIPTHTGDSTFPRLPVERGRKTSHRKTRSSLNAGGFSYANFKTFPPLLRILKIHFQSGDICKYWSPGFLLNNPNQTW